MNCDLSTTDASAMDQTLGLIQQGEITDRFIPQVEDRVGILVRSHLPDIIAKDVGKRASPLAGNDLSNSYPLHSFTLQNEYFFVTPHNSLDITNYLQRLRYYQNESGFCEQSNRGKLLVEKKDRKTQQEQIAAALGFDHSRVLYFRAKKESTKFNNSVNLPGLRTFSTGKSISLKSDMRIPHVLKDIAFKVLDAPGLRNDYYSNAVCWSKESNVLAVGLGSSLYTWTEGAGTCTMQKFNDEMISSTSYNYGGVLAIGTKNGKISIYDKSSRIISASCIFRLKVGIACIKWLHNQEYFFAGNDAGEIGLFEFRKQISPVSNHTEYELEKLAVFPCNRQQICGIDINYKNTQMAVGCNENKCTIYDISIPTKIVQIHCLEHKAAVKAVAFCPWMPNLLATGGGSKDRSIRFWHSSSGTLVKCFETRGQITSLIWSSFRKELLSTFGFGSSGSENILVEVYSYPSLKLTKRVESISEMRVLTADLSNDHKSICAGLSDQSVRIYSIWDASVSIKTGMYDKGIFESKLIELAEGISNNEDIR